MDWVEMVSPGDYVYFIDAGDLIPWVGGVCRFVKKVRTGEISDQDFEQSLFAKVAHHPKFSESMSHWRQLAAMLLYGPQGTKIESTVDTEVCLIGVDIDFIEVPTYKLIFDEDDIAE
jgi:hypothetical protein